MLRSLINLRNILAEWIILLSPVLAIFIMYILKVDVATFISNFIPTLQEAIRDKPGIGFTINTALIALLVNLSIKIFKHPGKLEIEIKSLKTRKDNSVLEVNNPRKRVNLDLMCNANFKFMWLKKVIQKRGRMKLVLYFPHWVDYNIENESDFKRNTIEKKRNEDKLEIDLGHALQEHMKTGKFSLIVKVGPNVIDKKEDYIISKFVVESKSMFSKCLTYILIILFLDFKESQHLVEARNDD